MIEPALTQLLSVGLVWISFHCIGMCGPIVGGVVGAGASSSLAAVWGLLRYQFGRALGLSVVGAIVGGMGAIVEGTFERAGGVLAVVMSALLLLSTVRGSFQFSGKPDVSLSSLSSAGRRRRGLRHWFEHQTGVLGDALGRQAQRLRGRPMLLGLVLSMLPCMIVLWALALAASTGSVVGGASVMALLVAMTTVPLLPAVLTARLATSAMRWPFLKRLPPLLSGLWLLLVGLAGLGVVEHQHVMLNVLGPRTVMLW